LKFNHNLALRDEFILRIQLVQRGVQLLLEAVPYRKLLLHIFVPVPRMHMWEARGNPLIDKQKNT
jgi:hypothetical protein